MFLDQHGGDRRQELRNKRGGKATGDRIRKGGKQNSQGDRKKNCYIVQYFALGESTQRQEPAEKGQELCLEYKVQEVGS